MVYGNHYITDNSLPVALYSFYSWEKEQARDFSFFKKVKASLRYFTEKLSILEEERLGVFFWTASIGSLFPIPGIRIIKYSFWKQTITDFLVFLSEKIMRLFLGYRYSGICIPAFFSPQLGEIVVFGIKNTIQDVRIRILNYAGSLVKELRTASWDGRTATTNCRSWCLYLSGDIRFKKSEWNDLCGKIGEKNHKDIEWFLVCSS